MFKENPLLVIWQKIARIEEQQAETLQILRSLAAKQASTPLEETPITTKEAACRFGIAMPTLYANAKKIKHTKRFGRLYWYPGDIKAYIDSGIVSDNLPPSSDSVAKPNKNNLSPNAVQNS
ncbi:hypothetical protein GCM10027592_31630 [Spirosoma flavus]